MNSIDNLVLKINIFCSKLNNKRTEPKVWHKFAKGLTARRDCSGNSYWLTFDPITGSSSYFGNEQEVRMWLDQRHYYQKK